MSLNIRRTFTRIEDKRVEAGRKANVPLRKVAAPGTQIDVPMNCKDDVYVRSHYDGMTLLIPDGPMPDEVAIIFCMGTGGRINARVGGMRYEEASA